VQPRGRWGSVELDGDRIRRYEEKPKGDGGWINGGFFVLSPEVGRYVAGDGTIWERDPLQSLAEDGQLAAYRHSGFWHAVDTLRDMRFLQEQWDTGRPPWKLWD
jgi:glucose-1-phosphate cytidylyltransferase